MRGVDEAKYITREKAWHKELGIVAESGRFGQAVTRSCVR